MTSSLPADAAGRAATTGTMRAVCLLRRPRGEPAPDDFVVKELPLPRLEPGGLLVRNLYMSVDPSMRGRLETTEKHYTHNFTPGEPLDGRALGQVVASRTPDVPVGAFVRHQLGWRDLAVVDAGTVTRVDPALAPLPAWLGLLGQTGFTAYVGLLRIGELRQGDTVLISAAAGAVGSAAGQFARLMGAGRVIGTAGGPAKCRMLVDELGYDAAIDYRTESVRGGLARSAPEGIDLFFDSVGGRQLADALQALNIGGRVTLCGMMSQYGRTGQHGQAGQERDARDDDTGAAITTDATAAAPSLDHLIQAVLKRLTLRGFIVRDHEDLRPEFERRVAGWLDAGLVLGKETVVDGLDHAVEAFLAMLNGGNTGKMLVRIATP